MQLQLISIWRLKFLRLAWRCTDTRDSKGTKQLRKLEISYPALTPTAKGTWHLIFHPSTRWWFLKYFWNFHPNSLGFKISNPFLTNIFFKWVGSTTKHPSIFPQLSAPFVFREGRWKSDEKITWGAVIILHDPRSPGGKTVPGEPTGGSTRGSGSRISL